MAQSGIYKFTEGTQEKILSILWLDAESYAMYRECIKPKYFKKAVHIDICRILFEYYEEFKKTPTLTALQEEISDMIQRSKTKAKLEEDYYETLDRMASYDLADMEFIKKKIKLFGHHQALVDAILQSAEILEKGGDESKIEAIIKDASLVGDNLDNLGTAMFDNIDERIDSYLTDEDVIERITTGSKLLDQKMKGGLGRTEMGIIIAPPKRGKTTFLIDKGAEAILHGYNVVHYSFENNEKQIQRNYDVRILQKDFEYIRKNPDKAKVALNNVKKLKKSNLYIKKYPIRSVTINTIRAHLRQLEVAKGFKADMIILDSPYLLKPKDNFADKRTATESNYEDARAVADEFNAAMWGGAQGNRASLSKKVVTMGDLAECFAIANTADILIALCQTMREKRDKIMRFFITGQRDSEDGIVLEGNVQYDIKKVNIEREVEYEDDDTEEDKPRRRNKKKDDNNDDPPWEGEE